MYNTILFSSKWWGSHGASLHERFVQVL